MRSKLFEERPKTAKISTARWVRILPDKNDSYSLFDALAESFIGRILFDRDDNWIYDGNVLSIGEQEEIAGLLTGHQKEMDQLLRDL
ncbi:hypothetical protein LJ707_02015 [Mucilaginibacter sp. UR6-1]|uniref:hypothetical protein n=1 Tax=Mucilaginibacter sp. UR6-1 TaxID=1435643 RepID=UPI001E467B4D|nr:hypothetical protein [Mucilaginibacter sp. UR6-1]MCC8407686.1 hypothetical protein [Mucilaginibacter sp. UR6-1]